MDPARLKKIPVFADLDDGELGHIAALAAEVSVPAGKELVREGDYSYDVLAIEEGTATVERHGAHVADIGPGDVLGAPSDAYPGIRAIAREHLAPRGIETRLVPTADDAIRGALDGATLIWI